MIRPALRPPKADPALRRRLVRLAEDIVAAQNAGAPCSDLIAVFNAEAGAALEAFDFHAAWEGDGEGTLVDSVLLPRPPFIPDISDDELLEIIAWVQAHPAGRACDWYLKVLELHLGDPSFEDLIFQDDLTPEEILTRARSYRPLITPLPSNPGAA